MPTRRSHSWEQTSPAMPFTPKGGSGGAIDQMDERPAGAPENADTFRRRVLPLIEAPSAGPSLMQQLSDLLDSHAR